MLLHLLLVFIIYTKSACLALSPRIKQNNKHSSTTTTKSSSLFYMAEGSSIPDQLPQQQQLWDDYITLDFEVPTNTLQHVAIPGSIPPRPKIVVFGGSGRIGRRVIRKLLDSGVDLDVVAFVRDRRKFENVLYDEEDLVLDNLMNNGGGKKKIGPKLHLVVSDVVSQRDVYQKTFETNNETKVLDDWVSKAKIYFIRKGWKYENSTSAEDDADIDILESGGEETLREAISGATVIVSCLSSFRPSNIWTDYLKVPILRVFRKDVSKWCSDPTHPYYVNYLSTKKIIEEAEKEQSKRDIIVEFEKQSALMDEELRRDRERRRGIKEEEGFESSVAAGLRQKRSIGSFGQEEGSRRRDNAISLPKGGSHLPSASDRIKFIRISHLMVGRSPFRPLSALTNTFWSSVSRYEQMGETLMEQSSLDTIVLRPGDLTDDIRNNHTSLQLCINGKVESPSVVGREDVADLAVVAALTKTTGNETELPSHHYKWGLRWTGQYITPAQGLRPDGLATAALCYVKAIKEQSKRDKHKRIKDNELKSYLGGKEFLRLKQWRRRLQPYTRSTAVSIPVYTFIGILGWYLFGQSLINLFARLKGLNIPQTLLKILP